MGHKQLQKCCSSYVSCIKINGKPILPPVVSVYMLNYALHFITNFFIFVHTAN